MFDKSKVLYRPTHQGLAEDADVLVVEGALDALAIAAAAAATGTNHRVAACATNGVAASPAHVQQVLSMTTRPPRVAFDGDTAGEQGAARWLFADSIECRSPLFVTRMPSGLDPADWLASHGPNGLIDLLARPTDLRDDDLPRTVVPGRELIRLLLDRVEDPIREAVEALAGLASQLPVTERAQLLRDSAAEMTRHGWNPPQRLQRRLGVRVARARNLAIHPVTPIDLPIADLTKESPAMSPHLQLEQATAQLRCAAAIAEQRALGDPRDPWSAMAGTILLIATGLDPMPSEVSVQAMELHGHLEAALAALDEIPADEEPTGLAFWRAHVADLEANAHTLEARAAVANGSDS